MASSRSPYGERGLKSLDNARYLRRLQSLSLRRAWIEIDCDRVVQDALAVALLTESVD